VDRGQLPEVAVAGRALGPVTQLVGHGEQNCGKDHDDGDDDQNFDEGETWRFETD
jgi:hypothetical protein